MRWHQAALWPRTTEVRQQRRIGGQDLHGDALRAVHAVEQHHGLEERMKWVEAWTDNGYVFTREDSTPLHPGAIGWHFEKLMKAAGMPKNRLHDLRHTHATLGLAAGIPVKVMSERLSHAKVRSGSDLYQHVMPAWAPTPPPRSPGCSEERRSVVTLTNR